ncbi:MAG TPA: hypothetical protein PLG05_00285 [Bacteroidales bacterium]|nr:hypothetical protein [Bacteroidales bacterium]HOR60460.1 hypothetical protein [Bacteroidales bacterium]HPL03592.1 hypothetical protein [Bacteroidales bacterium]
MENKENLQTVKRLFKFSIQMIDLYEYLIEQNKKPIAVRLLGSTLNATSAYQNRIISDNRKEEKEYEQKANNNLKNIIYWLEQCQKSGYLQEAELLDEAYNLQKLCGINNT